MEWGAVFLFEAKQRCAMLSSKSMPSLKSLLFYRLESGCRGNSAEGSNPSLSAKY